jgi:hypothetical protein
MISVGEHTIAAPNGAEGYRFRYLRADHSLLGGLWTGVSEMELKRMRSEVTEEEVVQRAESIYVSSTRWPHSMMVLADESPD